MKVWFPELDLLKATAIILIVFCHLDNYISCYEIIKIFDGYAALIGLSFFFFTSGFLLSHNDSSINSKNDIKRYYKKKFVRIYPLYWTAVASLLIIFGYLQIDPGNVDPYNFNLNILLIHVLGLQGIFPNSNIQSMWFVGVIIVYYSLYPIIGYLSNTYSETFAISSIILLILALLHHFLGLISINALIYYPVFISGIFINKILYSSERLFDKEFLKHVLVFNLVLICNFFLVLLIIELNNISMVFIIGFMISLCIIYLLFIHLYIKLHGKIVTIITSIAFSTYAIYLFQHQFLAIFSMIINSLISDLMFQDVIILTIGFAGTIICGIVIQKIEGEIFSKCNYLINHNIRL